MSSQSLRRKKRIYNHLVLTGITLALYSLSLISFLIYESNYNVVWFRIAYVFNAAGIVLCLCVTIPQLIKCMFTADDKIVTGKLYEPVVGILSLIPFIFTFIIHCDQWNEAQPFSGESVSLVIISLALLSLSALLGLFGGQKPIAKLPHFKIKTTFHVPFN